MAATLRLRQDRLALLCAAKGIENSADLARAIGISLPNVSRVLRGKHGPGEVFIASVCGAFPDVPFEELFERVPQ